MLQAYAGHMSITGEMDRPSIRTGPSPIDTLSGAHAAFGVAIALFERTRSGKGQYVETSLYDTALHMVSHYIGDYSASGHLPVKTGPFFAFSSPYGIFQARDREFFFGVANQRAYERFCRAIERQDLIEDERFADNGRRLEHLDELHAELIPIFASRDGSEWVELCIAIDIPASLVENLSEVIHQDQAIAREMVVPAGDDGVRSAGIPVKFSATPGAIRRTAPLLGEDSSRLVPGNSWLDVSRPPS